MSRRPDPTRLATAHRAGIRNRLSQADQVPEWIVDLWLAIWERDHPVQPAAAYWQRAYDWIASQAAAGQKPPA